MLKKIVILTTEIVFYNLYIKIQIEIMKNEKGGGLQHIRQT